MKKTVITITLILIILSTVAGTFFVKEGKANPWPMPGIGITLDNPQNITYNNNTITVVFGVTELHTTSGVWFFYSLDSKERKQIQPNITNVHEGMLPTSPPVHSTTMLGNFFLFNLSEGWHKLTVYCQTYDYKYRDDDTIDFFVDTVPVLSFLSFENRIFESSDVPLNFTVNQMVTKIFCSVDGQENVTINGNTTLVGLLNVDHNVTVYATDEVGNTGISETVEFNVAVPEPEPKPFPAVPIAVFSVATVVIVGAGLLVYFKKRKR